MSPKYIIYRTTEVHRKKGARQATKIDKFMVFEEGDDTPTLAEFLRLEHAITFVNAMGWEYEEAY